MTAQLPEVKSATLLSGVAQVLLGVASVVALLSFGGQIVLAPLLVPLQWIAAKRSTEIVRALFNVLAALLMAEFFVIVGYALSRNDVAAGVGGLLLAAIATVAFYRTTRPSPG